MCSSSKETGTQRNYQSYLLRLWRVDMNDTPRRPDQAWPRPTSPTWRASLEDARTGERIGFAGLEELLDFLREQISPAAGEPSHPRETPDEPG